MNSWCEVSRRAAGQRHHHYIAAGETFVAHKSFDEADGLAVGRDMGLGYLPLGLVNFAHVAAINVHCVETCDPPVVVAGTVGCSANPTGGIRQPIVLVNVHISG